MSSKMRAGLHTETLRATSEAWTATTKAARWFDRRNYFCHKIYAGRVRHFEIGVESAFENLALPCHFTRRRIVDDCHQTPS